MVFRADIRGQALLQQESPLDAVSQSWIQHVSCPCHPAPSWLFQADRQPLVILIHFLSVGWVPLRTRKQPCRQLFCRDATCAINKRRARNEFDSFSTASQGDRSSSTEHINWVYRIVWNEHPMLRTLCWNDSHCQVRSSGRKGDIMNINWTPAQALQCFSSYLHCLEVTLMKHLSAGKTLAVPERPFFDATSQCQRTRARRSCQVFISCQMTPQALFHGRLCDSWKHPWKLFSRWLACAGSSVTGLFCPSRLSWFTV